MDSMGRFKSIGVKITASANIGAASTVVAAKSIRNDTGAKITPGAHYLTYSGHGFGVDGPDRLCGV
jgi:hypothetical protein